MQRTELKTNNCMFLVPLGVTLCLMQTGFCSGIHSMSSRTFKKKTEGTQFANKCNLNLCNAAVLAELSYDQPSVQNLTFQM